MADLIISDAEAFQLAAELAQATGKPVHQVVREALQHERERIVPRRFDLDRARRILAEMDALPVRDPRSHKEIIADLYDDRGLPK